MTQTQRTRAEVQADIEAGYAAQDRYNRRTVNKGGPMQQEAHWRRWSQRMEALRAELAALPPEPADDDWL